jgi:hypothetical protein
MPNPVGEDPRPRWLLSLSAIPVLFMAYLLSQAPVMRFMLTHQVGGLRTSQ